MSRIFEARVCRTGTFRYDHCVSYLPGVELKSIIRQLPGKPVVLGSHDPDAPVVGVVLRAYPEYGKQHHAMAVIRIVDAEALARIDAGHRGCSIGNTLRRINGFERDVRVDHLSIAAIGRSPRGGDKMRILDEIIRRPRATK